VALPYRDRLWPATRISAGSRGDPHAQPDRAAAALAPRPAGRHAGRAAGCAVLPLGNLPPRLRALWHRPHSDRRSGLYSLLTLYRRERRQRWTDAEKQRQQRVTYHLYNAASHAYFLHLLRSADRPRGGQAAVVDAHGVFHEAQPRFLDLLDRHFPGREPHSLPFALPAAGTHLLVGDGLCARSVASGDLFIVWLWPAGPLDRLTAREREIVFAVAQGLSFKQAARKIGVAPSTVANHLYRRV
jgi:hypothetical protein